MCMMCEGATLDEYRFWLFGAIWRHGWAIVPVVFRTDPDPPWAYTIGLSAGFSHPELVITGHPNVAPDILQHLACAVRAGRRFQVGDPEIDVHGITVRFGDVHRDEWAGDRFAAWVDYYGALGPPYPEEMAVQVLWPDKRGRYPGEPGFEKGCSRPGDCQPLLSGRAGQ